ncbi:ribose-5-phosphate isomerase RpiA [Salinisphaera sp. USBA-960]|nr:ribose-5-phosphate isomerase RpiA [Salifodinibacter halophilus]NNC26474.1 ribose-5-phosphate isomerase RpiA [Salifodinibacter halophilus]
MTDKNPKRAAAEAAFEHIRHGDYLGVGTGSTVAHLIDLLAEHQPYLRAVVATSSDTYNRLRAAGLDVADLNETGGLDRYIDGADEINPDFQLIKGGGGALTREKIAASAADSFVCMADSSKQVGQLGAFGVPIEVIEMGRSTVAREIVKLGGRPALRPNYTTDNGHLILDVARLDLTDALAMEDRLNALPGVITNGVFARHPADIALIADGETVTETRR